MPKFNINDSVYKRDDPKTPLLILAVKSGSENVPSSAKKESDSKSTKTKHKKDEKVKEEEEEAREDIVKDEKEEGKRKGKRNEGDESDEGDDPVFQYRVLDTLSLCDAGWVPEDALVALPARARRSSSSSSSSSASSAQPAHKKRRLTGTSSSSSGSSLVSSSSSSSSSSASSLHQSGDSISLNESGEAVCPELGIKLPQHLQERLVDDAHLITAEKLVPPLPRHPSISDLLDDYREHLVARSGGSKERVLPDEVVESIVVYFNRFIDPCLLYPAEKAFFKPATKDKDPVEVYGVEHLLRFFARWPALCFDAKVSEDSLASIALRLVDIFDFIVENEDKYFAKSYVPPKSLKLSSQKRK